MIELGPADLAKLIQELIDPAEFAHDVQNAMESAMEADKPAFDVIYQFFSDPDKEGDPKFLVMSFNINKDVKGFFESIGRTPPSVDMLAILMKPAIMDMDEFLDLIKEVGNPLIPITKNGGINGNEEKGNSEG
jgi:hypothetical protein